MSCDGIIIFPRERGTGMKQEWIIIHDMWWDYNPIKKKEKLALKNYINGL